VINMYVMYDIHIMYDIHCTFLYSYLLKNHLLFSFIAFIIPSTYRYNFESNTVKQYIQNI